jgi:hypothetical protein
MSIALLASSNNFGLGVLRLNVIIRGTLKEKRFKDGLQCIKVIL